MGEDRTVLEAAKKMKEKFIGSVVVIGPGGKRTLFTERDLVMKVVAQEKDPASLRLRDVPTDKPVRVGSGETCSHCLDLMRDNRCRHLMAYDGEKFEGIIALRDVVLTMLEEREDLISHLEKYIDGSLW